MLSVPPPPELREQAPYAPQALRTSHACRRSLLSGSRMFRVCPADFVRLQSRPSTCLELAPRAIPIRPIHSGGSTPRTPHRPAPTLYHPHPAALKGGGLPPVGDQFASRTPRAHVTRSSIARDLPGAGDHGVHEVHPDDPGTWEMDSANVRTARKRKHAWPAPGEAPPPPLCVTHTVEA